VPSVVSQVNGGTPPLISKSTVNISSAQEKLRDFIVDSMGVSPHGGSGQSCGSPHNEASAPPPVKVFHPVGKIMVMLF
jgi:hypothetical protein